ncbi:MAG: hypothetical protein QME07_04215, partial [bacterium]|nr:hypothetical protein [bacterium]
KRFVRTTIDEEEINIFGLGRRDKTPVVIVGEAELRLNSIGKLKQLERKVAAVKKKDKKEIIKILITHYATPNIIKKAKERDITVIQSFEW